MGRFHFLLALLPPGAVYVDEPLPLGFPQLRAGLTEFLYDLCCIGHGLTSLHWRTMRMTYPS